MPNNVVGLYVAVDDRRGLLVEVAEDLEQLAGDPLDLRLVGAPVLGERAG